MKQQEKFSVLKSTRSSKNLIQPSQFVFYDKNIEEVETLISARVDNFAFIAVDKIRNFLN